MGVKVSDSHGGQESIVRFLKRHLDVRNKNGLEWQALCPYHDDKAPSFSVNIRKGLFICYACGAKGNMKQLAEHLQEREPLGHEITVDELRTRLGAMRDVEMRTERPIVGLKIPPMWETDLALAMRDEYWQGRGITVPTRTAYRLRHDPMTGDAVIPVADEVGRIAFFMRRQTQFSSEQSGFGVPRYRYPKGAKVSEYLFGADIALKRFNYLDSLRNQRHSSRNAVGNVLVITEGVVDAMSVYDNALGMAGVALLGARISPRQVDIIKRIGPSYILIATDMDRAGREAAMQVDTAIRGARMGIPMMTVEWSKDGGNASKDLNELLLANRLESVLSFYQQKLGVFQRLGTATAQRRTIA